MRAVLHTGGKKPWAEALGERPWALLPVAGRPLVSYWLELCVDLGISEVRIILGQDAEYIELFCGNGEKWGLDISYSFILPEDEPQSYLARDPVRWNDGLLYIDAALFPRRREDFTREALQALLKGCCLRHQGAVAFFISQDVSQINSFIQKEPRTETTACADGGLIPDAGLDLTVIDDIAHYYRLNMDLVRGEMSRYLPSGYASSDGASIGYNVITPSSVTLTPPLAIGNDCRIGALSSIGPGAVISDHVIIDRQCELSDCLVLSDTYIGRNLEIKGKIVAGNRIIDPEDGTFLDVEDPWLVAHTRSQNGFRDFTRAVCSWLLSLLLVILQAIPFLFFYSIIRLFGRGRFARRSCRGIGGKKITVLHFVASRPGSSFLIIIFCGTSLDRFPQLLNVLTGKLWLCGQVPHEISADGTEAPGHYFPAVFSYSDAFPEIDRQMDALYYAHTRSVFSDLRILRHALIHRLLDVESAAEAGTL
ncbi:MAG: hypothetical protein PWQ29_1107 [Verrucomicrobiota bacterium]|jgi:hypothetical protein|nr:hypothetical protein [Verrucomicrobiota bacterium]MDK2963713.1 hypothetical protein [Verrucomicrobiota bacterium]